MSWRDDLLRLAARFAPAWADRHPDVPVLWPNDEGHGPPADRPWLRVVLLPAAAARIGIGDDATGLYRHSGAVQLDVFAPVGEGASRVLALADEAAAILRGWSADGSRFGAPSLRLVPGESAWVHAAVTVPVERDTLFPASVT